jgi:lysophospholipase L1-like esterase
MRILLTCIFLFLSGSLCQAATIAIAGDSMAATSSCSTVRGWGQYLGQDFSAGTTVNNFAASGSSVRSFLDGAYAVDGISAGQPNSRHRWQNLLATHPDYVVINFGINDAYYADTERYSSPSDFETILTSMIADCRAINAKPILVTNAPGRFFNSDGTVSHSTAYSKATADVAAAQNVPLYDLHGDLVSVYGASGQNFCWQLWDSHRSDISEDHLHFGEYGAKQTARMIANDLAAAYPELSASLVAGCNQLQLSNGAIGNPVRSTAASIDADTPCAGTPAAAVPEPSFIALLLAASLGGLLWWRRHR